ncbi:short-chain fatty acyl-CoA regulator family protein [Pararhodobacter aggregans]|uniref:Short-chain fatty acyl coenzyme A regulators C-terminal domain-containing protein n=1 Tax=Pararhodobacter aggregans TaxID=404875 RepID=A0A2T7UVJ8_9RHOB|nr:short-chain fatty acyl-CoA regulator family protein [Pararhodobacter aggregans]PVE48805.1 hypothetical protein DDE23_04990 [Pararhodobacter aggregans]
MAWRPRRWQTSTSRAEHAARKAPSIVTCARSGNTNSGYAPRLIYAQDLKLDAVQPVPIGVNCYLCERPDCPSRAYPPINRLFSFSERSRGVSSFGFAPDTN